MVTQPMNYSAGQIVEFQQEIRGMIRDTWNSIAYDILSMGENGGQELNEFGDPSNSMTVRDASEVCFNHLSWDFNSELYKYWGTLSYEDKIDIGVESFGGLDQCW